MTQQLDPTSGSIRLVIVQLDQIIQELMAEILEGYGARIFTPAYEKSGFEQVSSHTPHVVLIECTDHGKELARQFLASRPEVRIVMMTADGNEHTLDAGLRAAVQGVIRIPFDIDAVRSQMTALFLEIRKSIDLQRLVRSLTQMKLNFSIPTDPAEIPPVLIAIGRMIEHVCPPFEWPPYETSLLELIQNAIEHGNLEIDFDQKSAALRGASFEALLARRMQIEPFSRRTVQIDCSLEGTRFDCLISDQGRGFDWRRIMDTIDQGDLERLNGRGLIIVKHNFDRVEYNETGNQVRVVKDFDRRPPA